MFFSFLHRAKLLVYLLVYDDTNRFAREARLPEASGFNMAVDSREHTFYQPWIGSTLSLLYLGMLIIPALYFLKDHW